MIKDHSSPRRTPCLRQVFDAAKSSFVALVAFALAFFLPADLLCRAAESPLAILDAGVERSEDAPFAAGDYRFYPGDYLYFRFQIGGFAIHSDEAKQIRSISLAYEVTPLDAAGIPLAAPASDTIKAELNPEDKNWTPKRRVSFLLPSFMAAGEFHLRVTVKDLIANTETTHDYPFGVAGTEIVPSSTLTVENFRYFRKEDDRQSIELPAYRPGDTVYARFDMVGHQFSPDHKYHLAYGLTVNKPDGKVFVQEPNAAQLTSDSFYPAQFVPGDIAITTSHDSPKGVYVVLLNVKDLIANRTYQAKSTFSLE
ncbi:MAG TPA: hypothetical protein VGG97_26705 [Bryobacteraceae bacterium]|jgi:hypothetical protein